MCVECWVVFSQGKSKEHKDEYPEHRDMILPSKYFCTQNKFISLAIALKRLKNDGKLVYFENPYSNKNAKREYAMKKLKKTI